MTVSRSELPVRKILRIVPAASVWSLAFAAEPPRVDFQRQVEPILRQHCTGCHGQTVQSGGLRLDNSADAMRGGYSGIAIKAGDGAGSRLVKMLVRPASEGPTMPLGGDRLSPQQVALVAAWIDQGADWPETRGAKELPSTRHHWSLRATKATFGPQRPATNPGCAIRSTRLSRPAWNPRVSLLPRRHRGPLCCGASASTSRACRRGPAKSLRSPQGGRPTRAQWSACLRRPITERCGHCTGSISPDSGKSDGYQADYIRPYAWRWRDWVIDAFNRNAGFDSFTVEQIAGDLLPGATVEQHVATGFHRNALHNREGGFPIEMDRVERVVERTSAVSTVWLGLTAGCARCHDHKFDPISQRDFYGLYAFFNTAVERDIDAPIAGERHKYVQRRPEFERRRADLFREYRIPELQAYWEARILEAATDENSGLEPIWKILWELLLFELDGGTETVRTPLAQRTSKQSDLLSSYFVRQVVGGYDFQTPEGYEELEFSELKKAFKKLEEDFPGLTQAYTIAQNPDPPKTRILLRGDYRSPGVPVKPSVPAALAPLEAGRPDRLAFARWLVSPANPLTARVTVNRIWQQHFGTGLVSTPEDFGTRGERPSHPELLDWLAVEFMDSGWDLKALHRLIVTSSTYRQSSDIRPDLIEIDPSNRLLARQARIRLPAEIIRDSAFVAAGLLDRRIGGESVRPFLPEGATEIGFGDFVQWPQSVGADNHRRGLYIFRQRTLPYPQLETFDAPDTVQVACQRDRSTTPLQALTLLNDPVFAEAARQLAVRIIEQGGTAIEERIRHAFLLCLSRDPSAAEIDRLTDFLELQRHMLSDDAGSGIPVESAATVHDSNTRAWTAVASVLLNLAEFLTRT